ncbi:tetratricopeptide repeat protein, partial [Saccharothrix sp. MB29]|nr:tetratricopeptide repeat protein [Saccharothrix sp. MB29]
MVEQHAHLDVGDSIQHLGSPPPPPLGFVEVTQRHERVPPEVQFTPLGDEADALAWFTRNRQILVAAVTHAVRYGFNEHAWRLAANFHEAYDRSSTFGDVVTAHRAALKAAMVVGSTEPGGNAEAVSGTHSNLGMALYRLGRFAEARSHFEAGMAIAEGASVPEIH